MKLDVLKTLILSTEENITKREDADRLATVAKEALAAYLGMAQNNSEYFVLEKAKNALGNLCVYPDQES